MSLAEAMAVLSLTHGSRACHIAEVDQDDPAADLTSLEEVARYCRRFAPLVAIEKPSQHGHGGPECLQIDVTGTAGFFGGEGPLVRTVVWTLATRGIHARAAIADTPAAAWAAARHTDSLHAGLTAAGAQSRQHHGGMRKRHCRWAVVPPGAHLQALAELPATALRLDTIVATQLRDVGIETIGGIARLPRKSLASRFAPQLSQRLAEFTGERPEPLVVPCSGELPTASLAFDFPLLLRDTTQDDLVAVIERLLHDCVTPLVAKGEGVMSLQVRLERSQSAASREACPPAIIDIGVFQPSSSVKHLTELIKLRLARMRLPREIEGITVEVVSVGVAECRQRTLFGEAAETSAAQVGMLMDRLSGRLGRGAVFEPSPVADAQPEHAWAAVSPAARGMKSRSKPAIDRPQRRPIWLLPRPVRLETVSVVGSAMDQVDASSGPPVRFCIGDQRHEIVKAHGPERIETAWWRGPTVRRDYYVVETSTGGRYWIFRQWRGEWFLHGTFS
jgi:protein ImuB